MTDINFYVCKQDGFEHRLKVAFKLISYALKRKMFIHIHTDNESMNKRIDNLLWQEDRSSFIPHKIVTNLSNIDNEKTTYQVDDLITISHEFEPLNNCDYLINLSDQRPAFFSRYLKLAEIIDNTEHTLTAGRNRYVFYRERGYNLSYHRL